MTVLYLTPLSLREANAFVDRHHRHHKAVTGHKFSIGCSQDGQLVGVAIMGRPVSRYLDDGLTLGGKSYGLPQDHHLYPGHRTRNQPPGGGLVVRRSCWRGPMDGKPPPRG